jgi:DNA-binding response OmpR family regulator
MQQKLLIVDDSVPQHSLIKVALEEQPIAFYSAFAGAFALKMAVLIQPDLILLDVDMPEMNGFDVCRLLKADPQSRDIPVIFLTASSSMDERICGFSLGAVDYITKPFDPAELCARVGVVLRAKQRLSAEPTTPHADEPGLTVRRKAIAAHH